MKEFTVMECLIDDKIHDCAVFSDGTRKIIQSDDDYGKYFAVDNELNDDPIDLEDELLRYSFTGRIKDAIDTIKDGNGDYIHVVDSFGDHIEVLYFIDRSIGNKLRQKVIDDSVDFNFGWCIGFTRYGHLCGFINEKDEIITIYNYNFKLKLFNTREDAIKYIDDALAVSKEYAQKFTNEFVNKSADTNKNIDVITKIFIELAELRGSYYTFVSDFVKDMIQHNGIPPKNDEYNLNDCGYKIMQGCLSVKVGD